MTTCGNCKHVAAAWFARCPKCHSWDKEKPGIPTLTQALDSSVRSQPGEAYAAPAGGSATVKAPTFNPGHAAPFTPHSLDDIQYAEPVRITEAETTLPDRTTSGFTSLNRVLGGGLVVGSAILIGGEPGCGKSTLLAQALANISRATGKHVLYATGEESVEQATMRAQRIGATTDNVWIIAESDIDRILGHAKRLGVVAIVIDSIQTVGTNEAPGARGSLSQVKACCARAAGYAKATNTSIFIIGHINKDGAIAGPKTLEHLVDVTMFLELGEFETGRYRYLRSFKNRFGSTQEVGAFEMVATGMLDAEEAEARESDRENLAKTEAQNGAEVRQLRFALRAALETWCPRDPGGNGADGETYRLALEALAQTNYDPASTPSIDPEIENFIREREGLTS